jgi:hypothetical protein
MSPRPSAHLDYSAYMCVRKMTTKSGTLRRHGNIRLKMKMSSKFTDSNTHTAHLFTTFLPTTHTHLHFILQHKHYTTIHLHTTHTPHRIPGCWRCAVPFPPHLIKHADTPWEDTPQGVYPRALGGEYQWARSFNAPRQQIV